MGQSLTLSISKQVDDCQCQISRIPASMLCITSSQSRHSIRVVRRPCLVLVHFPHQQKSKKKSTRLPPPRLRPPRFHQASGTSSVGKSPGSGSNSLSSWAAEDNPCPGEHGKNPGQHQSGKQDSMLPPGRIGNDGNVGHCGRLLSMTHTVFCTGCQAICVSFSVVSLHLCRIDFTTALDLTTSQTVMRRTVQRPAAFGTELESINGVSSWYHVPNTPSMPP